MTNGNQRHCSVAEIELERARAAQDEATRRAHFIRAAEYLDRFYRGDAPYSAPVSASY
ncbi:MAG TPA: hypothetical protein VF577_08885 [Allosphingosinicella sp.]|jgi:hypothetical protein